MAVGGGTGGVDIRTGESEAAVRGLVTGQAVVTGLNGTGFNKDGARER